MENAIKLRDLESLAAYRDGLYRQPRLTYLFFELTDACNLCCIHCGSSASPANRTYLPLEGVRSVLESVAAKYPPESIMICLSGGEPLLHPNFFEIAAMATKLGFSCGITTNGTLIGAHNAHKFLENGIRSVTFSLDGLRESHDRFRNRPGSFDRTLEGIRSLQEAAGKQVGIQVTTVIHRENIGELEDIFRQMCLVGVDSWRVINLEPIGRALHHSQLLLRPEEYRQLLEFIREKRYTPGVTMDVTYGCSHYLTPALEREVRDYYFICGSGIYVASILCNGDIYSCMDIERRPELVQGNIFRDDFTEVWENRFQAFREDRTERCETCRQCADRRFCRGDAAHTWDYDRKEPMLCIKQQLKLSKGE